MPFMRVIAGRMCLLMISLRSETVLYGLIDAIKVEGPAANSGPSLATEIRQGTSLISRKHNVSI